MEYFVFESCECCDFLIHPNPGLFHCCAEFIVEVFEVFINLLSEFIRELSLILDLLELIIKSLIVKRRKERKNRLFIAFFDWDNV